MLISTTVPTLSRYLSQRLRASRRNSSALLWSEIESFEVPTSINWWLWGGIIAVLAVTIGIAAVLYIIRYERRK